MPNNRAGARTEGPSESKYTLLPSKTNNFTSNGTDSPIMKSKLYGPAQNFTHPVNTPVKCSVPDNRHTASSYNLLHRVIEFEARATWCLTCIRIYCCWPWLRSVISVARAGRFGYSNAKTHNVVQHLAAGNTCRCRLIWKGQDQSRQ